MENHYLITVSSFYKAMYARDKLAENGISVSIEKVPVELVRSCSQGIYLSNADIEQVKEILNEAQIEASGIYEIVHDGEVPEYKRII